MESSGCMRFNPVLHEPQDQVSRYLRHQKQKKQGTVDFRGTDGDGEISLQNVPS
ncbi:hypothetical protein DEO72_LG10g226 [Vigna unguiculata]|uniref:Uncharacterized protein n=1 Tax=Vigna unguiculata TaxID=3917 RepID=A0A4D6NAN0_VIGUN|nr:hypothetical protein DEO72_LG10g226 [Vigna unguiculata]